jgi:hypothetical protein
MLSVCACSSIDRIVADPDEFEPGLGHAFLDHRSSAFLTQALSGTRPSCAACWCSVSLVARLTSLTNRETGTEKA